MAKKISELTAATTPLAGTELVEIVQSGVSKQVAVSDIGGGGGGGGLTNFTDTKSVAAPNATVPVVALTADGAEANIDFAIVVKGTGSIAAQIATSSSAGGNKRGSSSVDWQMARSGATQVSSGAHSVIAGGWGNLASAAYAAVGGGITNAASGQQSAISGGNGNTANNQYSSVGGGNTNTASGQSSRVGGGSTNLASADSSLVAGGSSNTASGGWAAVGGGYANLASGSYSTIPGGYQASTRGIHGMFAYAAGGFAGQGDAQIGRYLLRRITTDATATVLTANGSTASASTIILMPNNSAYTFSGKLVARQNTTGDCASWRFEGTIRRSANAAATALVAAVTPTSVSADAGAAAWTVTVTADTTNGALTITVTGEAGKTIRWLADVETVELSN